MEGRTVTVGLVALHRSQALDLVGPADAFAQAGQVAGARVSYAVTLLGTGPGPITAASGLRMLPDRLIGEVSEPFDTLLVAGSPDYEEAGSDPACGSALNEDPRPKLWQSVVLTGKIEEQARLRSAPIGTPPLDE